jgi:flagellar FliL protein
MAKVAKTETEAIEVAPPKKSKKLLIIIASALVLVLVIVGAAAFVLVKGRGANQGEDEEQVSERVKSEKKKGAKEVVPVYVALDAFTVNLIGDQFLQLIISVEVEDQHVGDRLKSYTPKLRNNVMMLLSSKKSADLMTKEGKETLANEIRDLMNEILDPGVKAGHGPIKEVLFTSFIIQ